MCRKKEEGRKPPVKKRYKGTLKGGLELVKDSQERNHNPFIGVVDDLLENEEMIKEHVDEPKHFGIHVAHLETMAPDIGKDDDRDMSIIANMFR